MKIKLSVLTLLALALLGVGTAQAFRYRMTYAQAVSESKYLAKELCYELEECIAYGVGKCFREGLSRFGCIVGTYYESTELGNEIKCSQPAYWGVAHGGHVKLKHLGQPQCFTIEAGSA